ncbi:MAG: DUF3747 domain-containing protein, partial [Waterburya sp.]
DTAKHWGSETIKTMSAYCGVASPYQETGNAFNPDKPAERDYAAAATIRTHHCLTGDKKTQPQAGAQTGAQTEMPAEMPAEMPKK